MSMKRPVYLLMLGVLIQLYSCQKENNDPKTPVSGNLKDITVSSAFNWSTSKTIDVNITGLPTEYPVFSTLVISLNDGSSLYQATHDMSQNSVIQIIVPVVETKVKLKYGSGEFDLPINGNKVEFSFLPIVKD
jgi:hypothetical protein